MPQNTTMEDGDRKEVCASFGDDEEAMNFQAAAPLMACRSPRPENDRQNRPDRLNLDPEPDKYQLQSPSTVFGSLYSTGINKQYSCESFYANQWNTPSFNQFNFEDWKVDTRTQAPCMTSAWRVMSFFTIVFVVPTILIAVPLYARYQLYYSRTIFLSDGEVLALHDTVSSFWCQSQRITSNGSFSAFFTADQRTDPDPDHRRTSKWSGKVALQHDEAERWGFYLAKGSEVKFSSCARWPGATLIVAKGEENMRKCFYMEKRTKEELVHAQPRAPIFPQGRQTPPDLPLEPAAGGDIEAENHGGELIESEYPTDEAPVTPYVTQIPINADKASKKAKRSAVTGLTRSDLEHNLVRKDDLLKIDPNSSGNPSQKEIARLNTFHNSEDIARLLDSKLELPILQNSVRRKASHILSIYNSTNDVEYGNSSYSSSEEFMSHCTSTIFSIDLTPYVNCSKMLDSDSDSDSNRWSFSVNESDYYFFLFSSDNSIEVNIMDISLQLGRVLYDVTSASLECPNATKECQFPLPFWQTGGAVVDFYGKFESIQRLEDLNTYEVTSYCQPRSIVYTVLILLVPFVIILFAFR